MVNILRFAIFMEANFEKNDLSKLQTNKGFIMYSLRVFQMFTFTHACKNKSQSQKRGRDPCNQAKNNCLRRAQFRVSRKCHILGVGGMIEGLQILLLGTLSERLHRSNTKCWKKIKFFNFW